MIKQIALATGFILLPLTAAQADPVETSNQAISICKAHIKENVEGYKRLKLGTVRSRSSKHTLSFAVSTETGRSKTICEVDRSNGTISLKS